LINAFEKLLYRLKKEILPVSIFYQRLKSRNKAKESSEYSEFKMSLRKRFKLLFLAHSGIGELCFQNNHLILKMYYPTMLESLIIIQLRIQVIHQEKGQDPFMHRQPIFNLKKGKLDFVT